MPSDFAGTVATRIRELRLARGLSVRELARRSGLAPESVSRSERCVNEISLTNLDRLCKGLGVDIPTFFEFGRVLSASEKGLPDLIRLLQQIPPASRADAVRALGSLLDALQPPKRLRKASMVVRRRR